MKTVITVKETNHYGKQRFVIVSPEHLPLQKACSGKSLGLYEIKALKEVGFTFVTEPSKTL